MGKAKTSAAQSRRSARANPDKGAQLDLVEYLGGEPRPKKSHLWALDADEHYVEEQWVDDRLFAEEPFKGTIYDPCCGFGRIVSAAKAAGFHASGTDLIDRSRGHNAISKGISRISFDFLDDRVREDNIVMNPPFKLGKEFVLHALTLADNKVAAIFPTRRLNAAGAWMKSTPLYRIWLLTPRPSMPPGQYITAGKKVGGGTVDFCWCVWLQGYDGRASIEWLHRDGGKE